MGHSYADEADVTVLRVSIDTDSNNDGMMNDADDLTEEDSPGKLIVYNRDDDNGNGIMDREEAGQVNGEDDLAIANLSSEPKALPNGFKITLEANIGGSNIKVWESTTKGKEIVLPKTYVIGRDAIPPTVYIEGYNPGEAMLRLVLKTERDEEAAEDKVKFTVLRVDLWKVSFSGASNHTLKSDDQATTFSAPHFVDDNLDGDTNDPGERSYPVCYTRNSKMKVEAEFKVDPPPTGASFRVKGDGPGNLDIPETEATFSGNIITMPATEAANAFADEIAVMEPMHINWQVSFHDGRTWCNSGWSHNVLYVTWDDPEQTTPIQTLVHVGCEAADGLGGRVGEDDDDVLNKVWAKFQTRSIRRASDSILLTYYGFYDANGNGAWDPGIDLNFNYPVTSGGPPGCSINSAEGLIAKGNGQCFSWVDFMTEVMKAQGLSQINGVVSKEVEVRIKPDVGVALGVKNWAKTGSSPREIINYDAGIDGSKSKAPDPANDEAADAAGVTGQGHPPNPASIFVNHWIAKMNGRYYDPSYGLGPYTDRKAYEDDAFVGSIDQAGDHYFLEDLPQNNGNSEDRSDEIGDYMEFAFP